MHIGIIGGGRMGQDVFDIFSRNGFQVTLYVRRPEMAGQLDQDLLGALRRRAAKGGSRGAAAEAQLKNLKVTSDLADLATCDLISENIAEDLEVKHAMFKALDGVCSSRCIFTSDSSFITPDLYAEVVSHPERVVGLHFFYPTRLSSFVEVIPGAQTSEEVVATVEDVARQLKLRPLRCKCVPGFLVNRMIPSYYSEGIMLVEEGYYTATEIDGLARAHVADLGPLETGDMIGLDLLQKGTVEFPEMWRDGWCDPPVLIALDAAGRHGVKTGRGFYRYEDGKVIDDTENLPPSSRRHCVEPYSKDDIVDRLYFTVVVEAFRHLDLGLGSEEDIDATLKEVLTFKSGPIESARKRGLDVIRAKLPDMARRFGQRFEGRGTLAP